MMPFTSLGVYVNYVYCVQRETGTDLGQSCSAQEDRHSITSGVDGNLLQHLDSVVCQEVVELQPTDVSKHTLSVVPLAVIAQDVAIIVQELTESVQFLVGPQRLHGLSLL